MLNTTTARGEKYDRNTVRAVLDLLHIESFDRSYINGTLFICEPGESAWDRFRGEEETARFAKRGGGYEIRGTGHYKLNDAAVDRVLEILESRK